MSERGVCLLDLSGPAARGRGFVRWNAPELGTSWAQTQVREKFYDGQLAEMNGGLGRD
jgi:hypothetical protein